MELRNNMLIGRIYKTPDTNDSDDLRFFDGERRISGFAYLGKDNKTIGLIRCPECDRENYGPNVSTGICSWCGFDTHKIDLFLDDKQLSIG